MDIKLKDNSLLSLGSTISSAITANCTTIYVKDCPNISGIDILKQCVNLTRVRLDIGNVSGSIEELLSYTSLSGFSDNYEPQVKPRLIGTWTVNSWYLPEQLSQAQAAFDGLTIVGDSSKEIIFSDLAVQTIDSTKPNYNPAVAIILNNNSTGILLNNPPITNSGRWFMTKSEASSFIGDQVGNVSSGFRTWFYNKNTLTDTNKIVSSDNTATYVFTSFNEFKYFTGIKYFGTTGNNTGKLFHACSSLRYLTTSGNVLGFYQSSNNANSLNNQVFYLHEQSTSYISIAQNNDNFIDSRRTSNRYILAAFKDKYKGQQVFENIITPSRLNAIPQVKTYYDYCAPKITYDGTDVTMTVERASTIYYTTDGSTPTTDSTQYTQSFSWNGQGVIKAMAIDTTNIVGDIAYANDFYADTVADPTFTLDTTNKTVTINCTTSGVTIYYTLDGTCPNLESSVYLEPIETQEDIIKVRCFAVKEGMNNSNVVGKICVLDDTLWGSDGDSSYFAVQCIDSTKPNYNPAVSIILFNNGVFSDYIPGYGGYVTKTDAASITNFGTIGNSGTTNNFWFRGKVTVSNIYYINGSYNFSTFNEFKYFTNVILYDGYTESVDGEFGKCTKLEEITFPSHIITIPSFMFYNCTALKNVYNIDNVTYLSSRCFMSCTALELSSLPAGITTIRERAFYNCRKVSFNTLGSSCNTITHNINLYSCFYNTISIPYLHLEYDGVVTKGENYARNHIYGTFNGTTYKIYVGNGDQAHDEALLAQYVADTSNWSAMASDLDTWYNYLHPTT